MTQIRNIAPLILIVFAIAGNAQSTTGYYILNDTAIVKKGIVIEGLKKDNSHFITIRENGVEIRKSPKEVSEYGTDEGDVYISRNIQLENMVETVFLHQLMSGWFSLYAYYGEKTIFLLENNKKELIELQSHKKVFRSTLKTEMISCSKVEQSIEDLSYNQYQLTELVRKFNYCNDDRIPRFAIGGIIGLTKISTRNKFDIVEIDADNGLNPVMGIWIEAPFEASRFAARIELSYTQFEVAQTVLGNSTNNDYDLVGNCKSIEVPLSFKINRTKNSGGINYHIGPVIRYNILTGLDLYISEKNGSNVTTRRVAGVAFPKLMLGAMGGLGYTKYSGVIPGIGVELRFSYLSGKSAETSTSINGLSFLLTYQL